VDIVKELQKHYKELKHQLEKVETAISHLSGKKAPKRRVSAASRKKMALAAKKRWAARKKAA
jgi:hypothetical protein